MSPEPTSPLPQSRSTAIGPVVAREMKTASHQHATYWLRVLAGAIALLTLYVVVNSNQNISPADMGARIFCYLHMMLVCTLFVWAPLSTSDCIAREKRDGTLGLLFLTHLNSSGIVIGKTITQAVRGLQIWLTVIPILAIPLLLGGLQLFDLACAVLIEADIVILGIAAGMIASAYCKQRSTALLVAFMLAVVFLAMLGADLVNLWMPFMPQRILVNLTPPQQVFVSYYALTLGLDRPWSKILSSIGPSHGIWFGILGICLAFSFLMLYASIRLAAIKLGRSWQDQTSSERIDKIENQFCTPFFKTRYNRSMSRLMNWNPIAWLVAHSWKPRLFALVLTLFILLALGTAELSWGFDDNDGLRQIMYALVNLFFAVYLYAGISAFIEEKRSGALELILITPISASRIIWGRAVGLWSQFFIPFVVLGVLSYPASYNKSMRGGGLFLPMGVFPYDGDFNFFNHHTFAVLLGLFLSLPFFSTYAALRVKNFVVAAGVAYLMTLLECFYAFSIESFLRDEIFTNSHGQWLGIVCTLLAFSSFVALTFFLLRHSLKRRLYSF